MAAAALDQKLPTLLRVHEEAFRQLGGIPKEILYDRMKTVLEGTDESRRAELERNNCPMQSNPYVDQFA
jgi:transposase